MITEKDLREAIAECQGVRNPNASTCIKLAAFYTILDNLERESEVQYSYSSGTAIQIDSDSDFAHVVNGRDMSEVMPIIDELMETLMIVNPPLYASVLRRFSG